MTKRKGYAVVIEAPARRDIDTYGLRIAGSGSLTNAIRWIDGIETAIDTLADFPERCPHAPETGSFGMEIRQLLFKSHRILFTVRAHSVHVLHVRHGARLPVRDDSQEPQDD